MSNLIGNCCYLSSISILPKTRLEFWLPRLPLIFTKTCFSKKIGYPAYPPFSTRLMAQYLVAVWLPTLPPIFTCE